MKFSKTFLPSLVISCALSVNSLAQEKPEIAVDKNEACMGESLTFSIKTEHTPIKFVKIWFGDTKNGEEIYSYITDASQKLEHIYLEKGEYTVKYYTWYEGDGDIKDPEGQTTQAMKITIGETPDLMLEDEPKTALITATSSNASSYTWYSVNRKGEETELQNTASTLYYLESGEYKVTAAIGSCKTSESISVKYNVKNEDENLTVINVLNNVITPNNDGINEVLCIEDVSEYENPCIVKVFDKRGKLVYENNNYTNTDGFKGLDDNGNELFAGTYYYVIKTLGRKGVTGFVDVIR